MGWFGKSDFEKHDESLGKKLETILLREIEIPELRTLCKNLIGSFPKNNLKLFDKNGNNVHTFTDPISRKDYHIFYAHYQELEEVTSTMLAKYFVNHGFLNKHDEDYVYVTTHNEDEKDTEDNKKKDEKELELNDSDHLMDSIILKLDKNFDPEKVIDEKELQNNIRVFLQTAFPNVDVEREAPLKQIRDSIDILVDGKYAIEVKIPNSRADLRNLTAQLEEYQEEYPDIIALIMDNEEKNLTKDIQHYVERYKSKLGIESVVKIGKKRG